VEESIMPKDQEVIDKAISELAADLVSTVKSIETSIETTQNHYGQYLAILSMYKEKSISTVMVLTKALIKAGANEEGVHSALSLLGINAVQEDYDEKEI
jgi:RNA binding exosome subunit